MLPTVHQGAINGFLYSIINAFVSPTGEGGLLSQIDSVTAGAQIDAQKFSYFLIPVFASTILCRLVRYVLGHVVFTILTLESLNVGKGQKGEKGAIKQAPTSRSVFGALKYLYRAGGLLTLFKGFPFGVIYWALQWYIARYLRQSYFSPIYLHPVANAISTVLLAELHLHWTQRMVCNVGLANLLPHWGRRRTIAVAALVQVAAETLLSRAPDYLSSPAVTAGTPEIVMKDLGAVLLVLSVRLFVYIPATINLIIVETSFLPGSHATIVPLEKNAKTESKAGQQQRGARVGEIMSNREGLPPMPFSRAWNMIRPSTCLWLFELYVKMCFVMLFVEFVCFMSIYLSV